MKRPNSLHSSPIRAAAAVVAVGVFSLMGSGCEAFPSPSEQTNIAAEQLRTSGDVVEAKSKLPTPADSIANSLIASITFQGNLSDPGVDREVLQTQARQNNLLGADKIIAASQAEEYYDSFISNLNYDDSSIVHFDVGKSKNELSKIDDPEVRLVMTKFTESSVVKNILNAVQYDYVEPRGAEEVLNKLNPNIQVSSNLLETLDAGNNVIHNYMSPDAVREDANDITDPKLQRLLEENAKAIEANEWKSKAYEKVIALYDNASKLVEEITKINDDNYRAFIRAKRAEGAEIDIREAIASHNAITKIDDFKGLRELDDPGRVIDLTGLKGSKIYVDQLSAEKNVEYEFAEVFAENGKPVILFSGIGIKQKAIDQLTRLTQDIMPMIATGMKNGDIVAIRFVTNEEGFNPYFHPSSKEVHMLLPSDGTMSEDQFRMALVHEVTHALTSSAFSIEGQVTETEAKQVKNACKALSTQAYDMFQDRIKTSSALVENLISTAQTEQDKKIFIELKKIFNEDKVTEIMTDASWSELGFNDNNLDVTMCAADKSNFGDVIEYAARKAGIERWQDADADLVERYIVNYKDAYGRESLSDYSKVMDVWIDATQKYSLWTKLNESAYVKTQSPDKEYFGHSEDNAREMMATIADITLNKTDEIIDMMKLLTPEDRQAVKVAIDASYNVLINRHPHLGDYLKRQNNRFAIIN